MAQVQILRIWKGRSYLLYMCMLCICYVYVMYDSYVWYIIFMNESMSLYTWNVLYFCHLSILWSNYNDCTKFLSQPLITWLINAYWNFILWWLSKIILESRWIRRIHFHFRRILTSIFLENTQKRAEKPARGAPR